MPKEEPCWMTLYLEGYKLERSYNKVKWEPITSEPYVGDGYFYRKAEINHAPCNTRDIKDWEI